jgi:hypothetical protein
MQLNHIVAVVTDHLVGRLLRRALVVMLMGTCAIVAIYYFTIAGNIALAGRFGDLKARLIIGAIYMVLALIAFVAMWAMRAKSAKIAATSALGKPREMQFVMLLEAVMLGYALARKYERTR